MRFSENKHLLYSMWHRSLVCSQCFFLGGGRRGGDIANVIHEGKILLSIYF
jgi:hypothetical protein